MVKLNVYGHPCPYFVDQYNVLVWTINSFQIFPPLRRREIYGWKKRKIWRKKRRRPHVGSCAMVRQERHLTTEDSTPSRHPATSRHLRYIGTFRFTPINPPGISWQLPIRRLPAIGSQLAEVMCTNWWGFLKAYITEGGFGITIGKKSHTTSLISSLLGTYVGVGIQNHPLSL